MARFRDSRLVDEPTRPFSLVAAGAEQTSRPADRLIGAILAEFRGLSDEQLQAVVQYQNANPEVRFGEAAVALGLVDRDDVMYALAQQFHYAYLPAGGRGVNPELVALNEPFSQQAEALRQTRSHLMMHLFADHSVRVPLAIVSPGEGEGKTFVTANLGIMFAQLGGRTLLIDADMRGPRLHRLFGLENNAGLSSVLAGRAEVHVIQQVAHVPGLYVLPVGILPPNPLELVERPTFTMLIREMASKFDYVLVDTPAAVRGADAAVIGSKCGAALVVARKNISRVSDLQSLVGSMTDAKTSVAGVVVNEF